MAETYTFGITGPLPFHLAATLMKLIGQQWPTAQIGADGRSAFTVTIDKNDVSMEL